MSALREFIKPLLSPHMRSSIKLSLHNLKARLGGDEKMLSVRPYEDIFLVRCGEESFYIVREHRWGRYRKGVQARIDLLGKTYGVPDIVKPGKGDIVLDIGANAGEFSILCSSLGATVHAIEADGSLHKALGLNTKGRDVTVHHFAIWFEATTLEFYSSVQGSDSSLIEPETFENKVQVQAKPLDQFFDEQKFQKVFLIKADAEGAEPELLKGAKGALKKTRYISLDCGAERRGETTVDECADIMRSYGLKIVRKQETGRCNLIGENPNI